MSTSFVETASARGLPAPLNARLVAIVHDLEDGRRAMSWQNLEELDAVNRRVYPEERQTVSS